MGTLYIWIELLPHCLPHFVGHFFLVRPYSTVFPPFLLVLFCKYVCLLWMEKNVVSWFLGKLSVIYLMMNENLEFLRRELFLFFFFCPLSGRANLRILVCSSRLMEIKKLIRTRRKGKQCIINQRKSWFENFLRGIFLFLRAEIIVLDGKNRQEDLCWIWT